MDASKLSSCTPGQRLVIETFDKPLMVAAGAGSGKTFTLTQRTANAFSPASGEPPLVKSLDEVLVITFTSKAAAELKDRIRKNLDSEGFSEAASRVDTAWVSTIHGMASRILRENALELGIDPAFEVISEVRSQELQEQAINDVIKNVSPDDKYLYELIQTDSLLSSTGVFSSKDTAREQAKNILGRVEALPAGLGGLVIEKPVKSPCELLTTLVEVAEDYYGLFDSWLQPRYGKSGRPLKVDPLNATEEKTQAQFEQAIPLAKEWLETYSGSTFVDDDFDFEAYAAVFFSFPKMRKDLGKKRGSEEFTLGYLATYAELATELVVHAGYKRLMAIVDLARRVDNRFKELKGARYLDNTDLLRCTYEALRDHKAIADKYRDQFKLIMVDEFQDTDKLQVGIIKLLAQPDLSNVCTVGDAQQSIYRFRGADVEVFKDYRSELGVINSQSQQVELGDNFRSHGDVLAIVDTIFRQQNAFGGEFLHLEPKGKVNSVVNPIFDPTSQEVLPRITFDVVQYKSGGKGGGLAANDTVLLGARRIADHFADLVERGVPSGSMALLLGKMTNADVYAQALRDVGIESVIAGGSIFCSTTEALLVDSLLKLAVNRQDEEALFAVLVSPLFNLSDDMLLILSRGAKTGKASLGKGFFAVEKALPMEPGLEANAGRSGATQAFGSEAVDEGNVGDGVSPAALLKQQLSEEDGWLWQWSRDLLRAFVNQTRTGSAAEGLRALFVKSGLFSRLEAQGAEGLASAGNLAKALQLVREFEEVSSGIVSLSQAYSGHLATAKEAPGTLSTGDVSCLRIMTVHASKGLEFAHVALADLKSGVENRSALVVENVGDCTYASLGMGVPSTSYLSDLRKIYCQEHGEDLEYGIRAGQTPGLRHEALTHLKKCHELEEAQRLLYVALTRAVESLYVECINGGSPTSKTFSYKGIMDIIYTALRWDDQGKSSSQLVEYGGSIPARVTYTYLDSSQDLEEALEINSATQPQEQRLFTVPCWEEVLTPSLRPRVSSRAEVMSYTALSKGIHLSHQSLEDHAMTSETSTSCVQAEGVEVVATDFGSAFHELAQRAILQAKAKGLSELPMPTRAEIEQKLTRFNLLSQADRLEEALDRWVHSDLAAKFMASNEVDAEVPFMLRFVSEDGQVRYLEGSIDALGVNESGDALLVDYKTGGFADEAPETLRAKHELQAKCYSLALLDAGWLSVDANFVRMEQRICDSDHSNSNQPQVVRYCFTQEDKETLCREITQLAFGE